MTEADTDHHGPEASGGALAEEPATVSRRPPLNPDEVSRELGRAVGREEPCGRAPLHTGQGADYLGRVINKAFEFQGREQVRSFESRGSKGDLPSQHGPTPQRTQEQAGEWLVGGAECGGNHRDRPPPRDPPSRGAQERAWKGQVGFPRGYRHGQRGEEYDPPQVGRDQALAWPPFEHGGGYHHPRGVRPGGAVEWGGAEGELRTRQEREERGGFFQDPYPPEGFSGPSRFPGRGHRGLGDWGPAFHPQE